jgi:D-apionolactonase
MEDQRNWTDHSFKTYGTPLRLPKPVPVKKGDSLYQKVTLRLKSMPMESIASESTENTLFESDLTAPFPRLGFALHSGPMDDVVRERLQELQPDHLRVSLDMTSASWENTFEDALHQARQLHTRLELVVVLGSHPWQEVVDLVEALTGKDDLVDSLSLINEPREVSQDGFLTVAEVLKKYLPNVKIGFATDGFFADLNRNRPPLAPYDFVAFSLNPQVHATDLRTIIENVSAQQYPVQTIRSFGVNAPGIHVSPLTFRIRGQANSHDRRLHTGFGAAITLLSLRYLAGVEQITYYQTHGSVSGEASEVSSLYSYFQQLREFGPDRIFLTQSPQPLSWDALVVGNAAGDKRYFFVNFSNETIRVQLFATRQEITLSPESITSVQEP